MFRFFHFESYYAVCLCFLPWQATYFLQEHLHFLCSNICGTAYPVLNFQRSLPPVCFGLSWRESLLLRVSGLNLLFYVLEMFSQPEVSLSVLLRVFCSYSLWCIRFCKGIHYSPHIYKSFFRLHILFCFLSGGYDLHLIFYHFCRYRYLFYIILHIFYLTDIIFIFTSLSTFFFFFTPAKRVLKWEEGSHKQKELT